MNTFVVGQLVLINKETKPRTIIAENPYVWFLSQHGAPHMALIVEKSSGVGRTMRPYNEVKSVSLRDVAYGIIDTLRGGKVGIAEITLYQRDKPENKINLVFERDFFE